MSYEEFWGAVVLQAVDDLLKDPEETGASELDREDAFAWLASDNTRPAGFLWACSVSGIEPNIVRRLLKQRGWL